MKSFLIVVLSLIICSFIYSQEDSVHSKYALSFGIGNHFTLSNFDMDIAVKKVIDEAHQLRLFLSPGLSSNNQEDEISGNSSSQDVKSIRYSLGVGVDYLWILLREKDIRMFGGTGLKFTYGNTHSESTSINSTGDKNTSDRNSPLIILGLRGTLGVEWMVSKRIGIHSEYLITGSYYWSKSNIETSTNEIDNPPITSKVTSITLGTEVLFGLSIYL